MTAPGTPELHQIVLDAASAMGYRAARAKGTPQSPAARLPLRVALRMAMILASSSPHAETLRGLAGSRALASWTKKLAACDRAFGGGLAGRPWCSLPMNTLRASSLRKALRLLADGLGRPTPDQLAAAYETILAGGDRKGRGAYYTPEPIVRAILDDTLTPATRTVCDPSCGTGRFLIEAARRLVSTKRGASRTKAIATGVFGVDLDPCAAELCAFGLWMLAADHAAKVADVAAGIAIGDSTLAPPGEPSARGEFAWDQAFPAVFGPRTRKGFDAVVGNPPFLGQLKAQTATTRARAARLAAWSGGLVKAYADEAAVFLLLSLRLARPGGRVCLVQPMSLLAAAHAEPIRREACRRAAIASVWLTDRHAFPGVGVYTCAPLFVLGRESHAPIARRLGPAATIAKPSRLFAADLAPAPTWSPLMAEAMGVPSPRHASRGTIADLADATADFRDQYYGLLGCIHEARGEHPTEPKLVTSGLIEPGRMLWGQRPCTVHKRRWTRPCVSLDRLPAAMRRWAASRLVPKLLIATQTRGIECVADTRGEWLPCVPVITVTPKPGVSLAWLAEILGSPLLSAIAMQRHAGSALSPGALKLSAKDLLNLPAPTMTPAATSAQSPTLDAYQVPPTDANALQAWWKAVQRGTTAVPREQIPRGEVAPFRTRSKTGPPSELG